MSDTEVAKNWLEAFVNKDLSLLNLADDFVHSSPFGVIEGKSAYLELIEQNREAFMENEIEVLDFLEAGSRFCVRYIVGGRDACDVIYVEDNQIRKVFSYYHFGETPSF